IYDGLGQAAAPENFAALAMRGHWVSYGQASGPLQPLSLAEKSGTFSQPVLFHFTATHLQEMAGNVFRALRDGTIRAEVRHRYPLAAASDAHRDLEARRTSGQVVLLT
ncbi:MAG TPA: zinc-binding dehydrogenase, partial [Burkholderiales bacterium]|nr:zinc-binding dehydrogenase [Burkholderiales bacterium]